MRKTTRTGSTLWLAAGLLPLLGLAAGCGGSTTSAGATSSTVSVSSMRIGLSINGAAIEFYQTLRQAAQQEATTLGVKLMVDAPTTTQGQNTGIATLLAEKVNALCLAPLDEHAIVPSVQSANAAKVPVITVDESSASGNIYTYIASPNTQGGAIAGQYIEKLMPNGGVLGVIPGTLGDTTGLARLAGLMSVLDADPDIQVVQSEPGNWVTDTGYDVASTLLTAHPNLTAIFAENDEMGVGALQAVQQIYKRSIPIIGYNGDTVALTAIKAGTMTATVGQDPTLMGQDCVQQAIRAIEGKPSPGPTITVPITMVDSSNVNSYSP